MNRLLPNGYAMLDGRVMHDDQWDGYPAERERLVAWIVERAAAGGRTVLLSGDVHSSWAFTGPPDPATGEPAAVEFTTPAVSSAAMGRAHYPGLWRVLDRAADRARSRGVVGRHRARLHDPRGATADEVRSEWWFVAPVRRGPGGHRRAGGSVRDGAGGMAAVAGPARGRRSGARSPWPARAPPGPTRRSGERAPAPHGAASPQKAPGSPR